MSKYREQARGMIRTVADERDKLSPPATHMVEYRQRARGLVEAYVEQTAQQPVTEERVTEAQYDSDLVDTMARTVLIDGIASEIEEDDELYDEVRGYFGSGQDLTLTIPDMFDDYGLDIEDYLPEAWAVTMMLRTDAMWRDMGADITVEDLYDFDSDTAFSLAMVLVGHGISPTDDRRTAAYMDEHGIDTQGKWHPYSETPYDEVMDAVTGLKAAVEAGGD